MQPPIRKRRKKSKNYFTHDTELAIVRYNGLDSIKDEKLRSDIYDKEIHYPFFKLTQNIIHTFKFYHTEVENLEHLQHEIIVFLLSKITNAMAALNTLDKLRYPLNCFLAACYEVFNKVDSLKYNNTKRNTALYKC